MEKWILFLSEIFVLLIVLWTSKWDGRIKQNRLFSITLPPDSFKNKALMEIQTYFQWQINLSFLLIFIASFISLFFRFRYVSLELIYFFILLILIIALPSYFYAMAHKRTKLLKEQEKWEAGNYSHGIHEDDFWVYGQFYNNPHDISRSVTKRMGLGTTLNMAYKHQKRFMMGTLVVIVLSLVFLTFNLFYMEIKTPDLMIDEQNFSIDYPFYYYHVPLQDIKDLTILQELPPMSKLNGIGTKDFSRGYYAVEGYGRTFVCIYHSGPYIAIKTNQETILVNQATQEETYALLEALDIVIPK